jgi:hypothetical protein
MMLLLQVMIRDDEVVDDEEKVRLTSVVKEEKHED